MHCVAKGLGFNLHVLQVGPKKGLFLKIAVLAVMLLTRM